jgi:hypothetical protein
VTAQLCLSILWQMTYEWHMLHKAIAEEIQGKEGQ